MKGQPLHDDDAMEVDPPEEDTDMECAKAAAIAKKAMNAAAVEKNKKDAAALEKKTKDAAALEAIVAISQTIRGTDRMEKWVEALLTQSKSPNAVWAAWMGDST